MDFQKIFLFLTKLKSNNNKIWFDENRDEYKIAREIWIEMTQKILVELSDFHSDFFHQNARKCVFRINRDVRFSNNKQPYKNNFGAYFVPHGKKSDNAGYYIHLEPGNSFVAAGRHAPTSTGLFKIRTAISQNSKKFNKIIFEKKLHKNFGEIQGNSLIRPPRGFEKEDPMIRFLKLKGFIFLCPIDENFFLDKNFIKKIAKKFELARPFVDFINNSLEIL